MWDSDGDGAYHKTNESQDDHSDGQGNFLTIHFDILVGHIGISIESSESPSLYSPLSKSLINLNTKKLGSLSLARKYIPYCIRCKQTHPHSASRVSGS